MSIKMPVIEIDSACTASDMILDGIDDDNATIRLIENKDYKYLTAMPGFTESGDYLPLCSKDLNHWVLCMGAKRDGEKIDLIGFAKSIEIGFPELRELTRNTEANT